MNLKLRCYDEEDYNLDVKYKTSCEHVYLNDKVFTGKATKMNRSQGNNTIDEICVMKRKINRKTK